MLRVRDGVKFNVFSGSRDGDGLAAALTNPTVLSRRKGTISGDYTVYFAGKLWPDAESVFLSLQRKVGSGAEAEDALMVEIIVAKLLQHPQLCAAVKRQGGVAFLEHCEHFTGARSERFRAWEGYGRESRFIRNLIAAYEAVEREIEADERT